MMPNATSNTTTTEFPPGYTISITLSLLIAVLLAILVVSIAINIYSIAKYRKLKQQNEILKLSAYTHSMVKNLNTAPSQTSIGKHSQALPSPIAPYAFISSESLIESVQYVSTRTTHDNQLGENIVTIENQYAVGNLSENHLYMSTEEIMSGTKTAETSLQIRTYSFNSNCEDTIREEKDEEKIEQGSETPSFERDSLQNESPLYYDMRDNPLYKEVAFSPKEFEQLALNREGEFSEYDALKH